MPSPWTAVALQSFLSSEPTLKELIERYPQQWVESDAELKRLLAHGGVKAVIEEAKGSPALVQRLARSRYDARLVAQLMPSLVRLKMMVLALKNYSLAAQTKQSGKVQFDPRNAALLQRLLFDGPGLVRKPVNLWLYRWVWPRVTQKSYLMPLVNKKGIYCFFSKALIRRLAALVAGRRCLEVGAGDGTLSRLLNQAGCPVQATDDHSWSAFIDYPAEVLKLDARLALEKFQPSVVIASWPDPENSWEQAIFDCPSVQTYVVIGSAVLGVTGNQETYLKQTAFSCSPAPHLAKLVLPQEQGNAVLVFQRTP